MDETKIYTIASEDFFVNIRNEPASDAPVNFIVSPGNKFYGEEKDGWIALTDVDTLQFMGYGKAELFRLCN